MIILYVYLLVSLVCISLWLILKGYCWETLGLYVGCFLSKRGMGHDDVNSRSRKVKVKRKEVELHNSHHDPFLVCKHFSKYTLCEAFFMLYKIKHWEVNFLLSLFWLFLFFSIHFLHVLCIPFGLFCITVSFLYAFVSFLSSLYTSISLFVFFVQYHCPCPSSERVHTVGWLGAVTWTSTWVWPWFQP